MDCNLPIKSVNTSAVTRSMFWWDFSIYDLVMIQIGLGCMLVKTVYMYVCILFVCYVTLGSSRRLKCQKFLKIFLKNKIDFFQHLHLIHSPRFPVMYLHKVQLTFRAPLGWYRKTRLYVAVLLIELQPREHSYCKCIRKKHILGYISSPTVCRRSTIFFNISNF